MEIQKYISSEFIKDDKISVPVNIKAINIDVGLSFNAPVSCRWLNKNPDLMVIGFEPNQENVNILNGNSTTSPIYLSNNQYKRNNISKFINKRFFILPYALSNKNFSAEFYNIQNKANNGFFEYDSGSSSLYRPKKMKYKSSKVKVFKLSELLKKINWEKISSINRIKIDAQGEDFNIIYGIEGFIKKVKIISYEINAPGYYGYTNYKWKNLKMFIYLYLKGFKYLGRTSSDITFVNRRYKYFKDELTIFGT